MSSGGDSIRMCGLAAFFRCGMQYFDTMKVPRVLMPIIRSNRFMSVPCELVRLMGINTRGTFMVSKYCIPHLKKAANPHILMLSPPLDMQAKWFEHSTAYTIAKFGMSMCVLGLSAELKTAGVAVNALWPRTVIATAAVGNLLGGDAMMRASRKPEIMGDAAYMIFTKPSRQFTGQFCIDDKVLYQSGVRDFEQYRVDASVSLMSDFFVPDGEAPPPGVSVMALPSVGGVQKSN